MSPADVPDWVQYLAAFSALAAALVAVEAAGFAISSARAASRTARHTEKLADVAAEQLRLLRVYPPSSWTSR